MTRPIDFMDEGRCPKCETFSREFRDHGYHETKLYYRCMRKRDIYLATEPCTMQNWHQCRRNRRYGR